MALRRRIVIVAIFLLGAFVLAIGIIRSLEFSVSTAQDSKSDDLSRESTQTTPFHPLICTTLPVYRLPSESHLSPEFACIVE